MPVRLADPSHGHFKNDRRLTDIEKDVIAKWVAAGVAGGGEAGLAGAAFLRAGVDIGKPDRVIDIGATFEVPESGTVQYKYFVVGPDLPKICGFRRRRYGRISDPLCFM